MNCIVALTTGFGLGLVSFGTLWLSVGELVRRPDRRVYVCASRIVPLFVVGVVFYGLSQDGIATLLTGLCGLWLARWSLIRRLGGTQHGR